MGATLFRFPYDCSALKQLLVQNMRKSRAQMVDDGMRMFHPFLIYILLLNLRVGQYPHIAQHKQRGAYCRC